MAVFTHCASHVLNLALNSASSVIQVRLMLQRLQEIGKFFDDSPCRTVILKQEIMASSDTAAKARSHLVSYCTTRYLACAYLQSYSQFLNSRWIERQDAVQRFFLLYVYIYKALIRIGDKSKTADHQIKVCRIF